MYVAGFNIRVVVAGQAEAERRLRDRHHGRGLRAAVGHVRHGRGERAARALGRRPAGHTHVPGGWLPGVRRVRRGPPVP